MELMFWILLNDINIPESSETYYKWRGTVMVVFVMLHVISLLAVVNTL